MLTKFCKQTASQELWANQSLRLDNQSDTLLEKKKTKRVNVSYCVCWCADRLRPHLVPYLQPAVQLSRHNLWPNCSLKSKIFTASVESFSSLWLWVRPRWGYTTTWLTLRSVASARLGPVFSAGAAKQTAWSSMSTLSKIFSDRTRTLTHFFCLNYELLFPVLLRTQTLWV